MAVAAPESQGKGSIARTDSMVTLQSIQFLDGPNSLSMALHAIVSNH